MPLFNFVLPSEQELAIRKAYPGLLDSMFVGKAPDALNITPQMQMPGAANLPLLLQPTTPGTGNVQPMGGNDPELARRQAAGAYNPIGGLLPVVQGPQAATLENAYRNMPAVQGTPGLQLLLQKVQDQMGPKAIVKFGKDERGYTQDPSTGALTQVVDAAPERANYSDAPQQGINPVTGKPGLFVRDTRTGNVKWLEAGVAPKINFVNGQAVDENSVLPGTVIPQQAPQPTPALSPERFKQEGDLAGIRAKVVADNRAPNAGLLPPATVRFYAEQALAGDPSVFAMVGRNQAARAQIAQAVQEMGTDPNRPGGPISGSDMAALRAQFAGDMQAQRTIGQRTGAIAVSGEEARGVASLVKDAYAKLPRGEFKPFNELKALVDNQTNSPEQGAAYAADFALQTAYARALNPQGVPRETDIAKAGEMLNTAGDSPEKHNAVVDQILKELDVIQNSTGAARIAAINKIREQHGLPAASGSGTAAPGAKPATSSSRFKIEQVSP
jgi:hypothetical protein